MRSFIFTKAVAAGNDFVIIDSAHFASNPRTLTKLAIRLCNRKFGIGADGLLFLDKSRVAALKMRIFNADGSEAEMCGNGARCAAWYHYKKLRSSHAFFIETKAGSIQAQVMAYPGNDLQGRVKIKLTTPKDTLLDIPIAIFGRKIKVNFVNTGVPHAVIFIHDIDSLDVPRLGREIRFHKYFSPRGTNVDFVQINNSHSIKVRTYERGVEDETLACGTGSTASAIITAYKLHLGVPRGFIDVHTRSKEILKVYFEKKRDIIEDVYLEGVVRTVFEGSTSKVKE